MTETTADDQSDVIAFLLKPESYSHPPETVERIDTHGAIIFLADDRAYKLKRAVRLAYLDFSTLEKRRTVCERELALNGMTAPEIYLGILPIYRRDTGELAFQGDGEIVDWVIEMRRFESDQLFDTLAERGQLDPPLVEKLAEVIEEFHALAARAPRANWPDSLEEVMGTVIDAFRHDVLADVEPDAIISRLRSRFEDSRQQLEARREAGLVRRCHGDMHLKNIILFNGEPRLFDALEFDEDLATIDVLYDLGFLLMDMWRRGLRREANLILNHYFVRETPDLDWAGLALLPLFLALRAGVRAMVGLDGLDLAEGQKRDRLLAETRSYAQLAGRLIAPPSSRLIAIGGLSGTGKTTVARALAPGIGAAPGAIHLRSDVERKRLFGAEPTQRLGEDRYSESASERVYETLAAKAEAILKAGHSVILDATFLSSEPRRVLTDLANRTGCRLEGVWLEAGETQMLERVAARQGDASDADAEIVRRQLGHHSGAPEGWHRADASGGVDETARKAAERLGVAL